MKSFLLVISILFVSASAIAQPKVDDIIKFETNTHSFGKIPKEKAVTFSFSFSNTSAKPLIIEDATAECGCTKPEFPKKPIMPGQKGTISVTYDAKEPGSFTKKVTVKLVNVKDPKILTISGEVVK